MGSGPGHTVFDYTGAVCDDSCEWALDGVCDDGSAGEERDAFDDDYGGFYGYDDDYYQGYGYYYYEDDDDFLAPVCEAGTDCTDCGGADPDATSTECTNTCQWANDNYCLLTWVEIKDRRLRRERRGRRVASSPHQYGG